MMLLSEALAWLETYTPRLPAEPISIEHAAGRILAAALHTTARPPHPTAAIDGHAVRASDTDGATDYAPLPVPGAPVHAGDPMPPGTDAVMPPHQHDGCHASAPVAPGHFVLPTGHNAQAGLLLPAGTQLRPLHLPLLTHPPCVTRRPRILLQVAPPQSAPDTLTPLLQALIAAEGATLATSTPDLILLAGPANPLAPAPGIAINPGETAALGILDGVPALYLPGSPLDCATTFALLAAPALRRMAGRSEPHPTQATLTRKITSTLGQLDAIRVRLQAAQATPLGPAEHGSLAAGATADGLVLVPEASEGYPPGATVAVLPLP